MFLTFKVPVQIHTQQFCTRHCVRQWSLQDGESSLGLKLSLFFTSKNLHGGKQSQNDTVTKLHNQRFFFFFENGPCLQLR